MGFSDFLNIFSPITDFLFQGANFGYNVYQDQRDFNQNQANIERQFGQVDRAFEANERNLEITRAREDNAIQRRSADLQAAGLNPLLAVGSPAGASAPIQASQGSGTASHHSSRIQAPRLDQAVMLLQLKKMYNEIEILKKQGGEIDARASLYNAEAEEAKSRVPVNEALVAKYGQDVAESISQIGEIVARAELLVEEKSLRGAQKSKVQVEINQIRQLVAESVARTQKIGVEKAYLEIDKAIREVEQEFTVTHGMQASDWQKGDQLRFLYELIYATVRDIKGVFSKGKK